MAKKTDKLIFRLTNGRKPASWLLPIKSILINKKMPNGNFVGKKVRYVKGAESIYAEDIEGDYKDEEVEFEDGMLRVHPNEANLVDLLYKHPWYGIHFVLDDPEAEAEEYLDKMEAVEKALEKVNLSDVDELKANAIILLGAQAASWSEKVTRQKLKQYAFDSAENLLEEMESGDYNAKFVAALSILRGIIEINPTRTKVLWADTKKPVLNVAVGQDPVVKLGQFLAQNTEDSKITLQELGVKNKRSYVKSKNITGEKEINEITGEDDVITSDDVPADVTELEKAHLNYKSVYDKDVPNNKKNDLEWINQKVLEAQG